MTKRAITSRPTPVLAVVAEALASTSAGATLPFPPRPESWPYARIASDDRHSWPSVDRRPESALRLFVLKAGESEVGLVHDRLLITDSVGGREPSFLRCVEIPGELLLECVSRRLGRRVNELSLHPLVDLTKGLGRAFGRMVTLAAELGQPDGLGTVGLIPAVAEALLEIQPYRIRCGARRLEAQASDGKRNRGPKMVRRVDDIIEARLGEELTVQAIADQAGVSARTLFRNYRRYRGRSPLQALREARLAKVRDALLFATAGESVTGAATRCGFTHLGRFSALYRGRFGERPSETLRRARSRSR